MGRGKHLIIHFNLYVRNLITNTWELYGQYPTIHSMCHVIGYTYSIIQNIRLGRHKMLSKFYKIEKIKNIKEKEIKKKDEDIENILVYVLEILNESIRYMEVVELANYDENDENDKNNEEWIAVNLLLNAKKNKRKEVNNKLNLITRDMEIDN